jgi:hypothetical protein
MELGRSQDAGGDRPAQRHLLGRGLGPVVAEGHAVAADDGDDQQMAAPRRSRRTGQARGAVDVDLAGAPRVAREVEDGGHALQRLSETGAGPQVARAAVDARCRAGHAPRSRRGRPRRLPGQHGDLVARSQQRGHDRPPERAGASGDQNSSHRFPPPQSIGR